jgi:Asp-tRNA(Asn)/Glu-tRNA(Gln) amidotransferase A subunit family amidase
VAVKDLFAIRGTRTRAGSRVMSERLETGDAAVVERLHPPARC